MKYKNVEYMILKLDESKYKWIVIGNKPGISGSGTSTTETKANKSAKKWIDSNG